MKLPSALGGWALASPEAGACQFENNPKLKRNEVDRPKQKELREYRAQSCAATIQLTQATLCRHRAARQEVSGRSARIGTANLGLRNHPIAR